MKTGFAADGTDITTQKVPRRERLKSISVMPAALDDNDAFNETFTEEHKKENVGALEKGNHTGNTTHGSSNKNRSGQDVQDDQIKQKRIRVQPMNYLGIYQIDKPLSQEEEEAEQKKIR